MASENSSKKGQSKGNNSAAGKASAYEKRSINVKPVPSNIANPGKPSNSSGNAKGSIQANKKK